MAKTARFTVKCCRGCGRKMPTKKGEMPLNVARKYG